MIKFPELCVIWNILIMMPMISFRNLRFKQNF